MTEQNISFRKDDDGSLTIFGLFIFMIVLMMAGMAVDLVRTERERVRIQNTIDTAVVAASSLTQAAQTEADVEALVRDHMAKAGYDPSIVSVDSGINRPEGTNEINSRWVEADVNFKKDTVFMGFLGFDTLPGVAASGAREGNQLIEIALVLDVSGSMGGQKLTDLKTAARDFVTTVLTNNSPSRTLISIIPYSNQVHMSDDLMARLNDSFDLEPVTLDLPDDAHPGRLAGYVPGNTQTNCVRFRDEDFGVRRLSAGSTIELSAHFGEYGTWDYGRPSEYWNRWCRTKDADGNHVKQPMFLWQNNELALHTYIDSLNAGGWTAIDYGMNWGVGVLDHNMQNIVNGMIDDGLAPASAAGFPVKLGDTETDIRERDDVKKYVVLMTDGINTRQRDLKDAFKSGPTRIWFSEQARDATDSEWDGFLVEMPDNPESQRWYIPGSPFDIADDVYLPENAIDPGALREDAVQWDHHALFNRFSVPDAADYFFGNSDSAAQSEYLDAMDTSRGWGKADADLQRICDKARQNNWIEVFTVAFEAPDAADKVLADCSVKDGNHFAVEGKKIEEAFAAIASEITKLRLTQ